MHDPFSVTSAPARTTCATLPIRVEFRNGSFTSSWQSARQFRSTPVNRHSQTARSFTLAHRIASFPAHAIAHAKAAVDTGAFASLAEGLLVEAHESDLSVASEVTQARVTEALKVGAETYEGELEMDYLSRLSPMR
jgi:hypothetical protein